MPKYLLAWEEIDNMNVVIEADSKKKALDKFWNHDYDMESVLVVNVTISDDGPEIEEI